MSQTTEESGYRKGSRLKSLLTHVRLRPNVELEQALIRLVFILIFLASLSLIGTSTAGGLALRQLGGIVGGAFVFFAAGLIGAILRDPEPSTPRRVLGMIGDLGFVTFGLIISGETGAPWWWVYLWVTFGNGFRFGLRFLYLSAALSLIGFGAVILVTPFWQLHPGVTGGMVVSLIVLPGYAAVLLRRLQAETERAETANRAKSDFLASFICLMFLS